MIILYSNLYKQVHITHLFFRQYNQKSLTSQLTHDRKNLAFTHIQVFDTNVFYDDLFTPLGYTVYSRVREQTVSTDYNR